MPKYTDIQAMDLIWMIGGPVGIGLSPRLQVIRRRSQVGPTKVTKQRRYLEPLPPLTAGPAALP